MTKDKQTAKVAAAAIGVKIPPLHFSLSLARVFLGPPCPPPACFGEIFKRARARALRTDQAPLLTHMPKGSCSSRERERWRLKKTLLGIAAGRVKISK